MAEEAEEQSASNRSGQNSEDSISACCLGTARPASPAQTNCLLCLDDRLIDFLQVLERGTWANHQPTDLLEGLDQEKASWEPYRRRRPEEHLERWDCIAVRMDLVDQENQVAYPYAMLAVDPWQLP